MDDDSTPEGYRADFERALDELERAQVRGQERAVAADPDPVHVQRAIDELLVETAVRRHAVEMLKLSVHRPQARELLPAEPFAQAQWHLLRIYALRAAPLDVAAAQLREEALTALTPKEK
jgi:hypothetical protein